MEENTVGVKLNRKTILVLGGLILLIIATAIGVYLVQQRQLFKPKASELKPISAPETSFALKLTGYSTGDMESVVGSEARVSILVRSDIDAANLFAAKLKFPADLLEVARINIGDESSTSSAQQSTVGATGGGPIHSFITNWVERYYDNNSGSISLVGGVPNPGYQTRVADEYPPAMVDVIFKSKKPGSATISFEPEAAIYRNSDNTNILTTKKELTFKIIPLPTPNLTLTPTTSPSASRKVFVTSTTYNGNLGGLSGADAKCQARADAGNLGGTWKAWLSDNTTSAASRLEHFSGQYKLLNGQVVADNWTDLIDGSLQNAISISETKSFVGANIWTGTKDDGSIINPGESKCLNWTSSVDTSGPGAVGNSGYTDFHWSWNSSYACSSQFSLYCFEQGTPSVTIVPSGTPVPSLKGDIDGDGKITLTDLSALFSKYGTSGKEVGRADLNGDGVVNTLDLSILKTILIKNGLIKSDNSNNPIDAIRKAVGF